MYMVTKPKIYDVIVTTNMFGDIITDLGAAIQGEWAWRPAGISIRTRNVAMHVRAVHGSAPDIAGKNFANPIAVSQRCDDARFPGSISGRHDYQSGMQGDGRGCEKPHPRPGRRRDDFASWRCGLRQDCFLMVQIPMRDDAPRASEFHPIFNSAPAAYNRMPQERSIEHEPTTGVENIVIIGSGPAAWTCAIYAARANLAPLSIRGHSQREPPSRHAAYGSAQSHH